MTHGRQVRQRQPLGAPESLQIVKPSADASNGRVQLFLRAIQGPHPVTNFVVFFQGNLVRLFHDVGAPTRVVSPIVGLFCRIPVGEDARISHCEWIEPVKCAIRELRLRRRRISMFLTMLCVTRLSL